MNKSLIPDPLCTISTMTPPSTEIDDNEWVAIKDTFPTINSQSASNPDIKSQSSENTYKFEVELTENADVFTVFCRKIEIEETTRKTRKLQPRIKNDSGTENREISQEFELIDVHSERLSIDRIKNSHKILFDLFGEIKIEVGDEFRFFPNFPQLTTPPSGLWAYLSSTQWDPTENCRILEEYLADLFQFCPFEVFIEVLFLSANQESNNFHQNSSEDENHLEKYEECFSELNKNTYQSNIKKYRSALQSLEESKSSRDIRTIEELLEYYCELDDACYFFERALSEMFQYNSQPILDEYQVFVGEREGLREMLLEPSPDQELSDEDFVELCDKERITQQEVLRASGLIHELTIYHLQELAQQVESQLEQTRLDKEACTSLWEKRAELRLLKLEDKLNALLISLLAVQVECLMDAKERTILSIVSMEETDNLSEKLGKKESTLFTVESQLIDIKLRLIAEKENMLKLKLILFEEDKENSEAIRSKLSRLGRRKARLRTKQRLVNEAGKGVGSSTPKLETLLEESFYSELVVQKRRDVNNRVASRKQDRLKKERVKVIERVKQKVSETPKDEKKLPPSYLPPSQRKGTLLDTTNNRKQKSHPNTNTKTQPTSRLTRLNISPSMAHHYPSIDSSISLSVNGQDSNEKKTTTKKLQPRTIRNCSNTVKSRSKANSNKTIENTVKTKENSAPTPNYHIPAPPPNIPAVDHTENDNVQRFNGNKSAVRKQPNKKVESQNPHETMMNMIRCGIKLKPTKQEKLTSPSSTVTTGAHASLLKAVANIGLSTQDSASDSPDGEDSNW